MKIFYLVLGILIGFSLTFIQSTGAEQDPVIKTVTDYQTQYVTQKEYVPVNQTDPVEMTVTAYTSGYESTQKKIGDQGYGITRSGTQARPGVCAVDPKYIALGTSMYVEGVGYCRAEDTGSKVRGNHIDVWMEHVSDALKFGRQTRKVWILNDY